MVKTALIIRNTMTAVVGVTMVPRGHGSSWRAGLKRSRNGKQEETT
jgi:hypothetical protein